MNKEDFIKTINGELWYKSDYAYWLYKQLEDRDKRIDKANVEIKKILEMAKDYEEVNLVDRLEIILSILRGKDNE